MNIILAWVLHYLVARLREPSTWTALSAIGILYGLPSGTVDAVAQIVGGVLALAGVLMPERGHKAPVEDAPPARTVGGGDGA